jgi:hypothetical protein
MCVFGCNNKTSADYIVPKIDIKIDRIDMPVHMSASPGAQRQSTPVTGNITPVNSESSGLRGIYPSMWTMTMPLFARNASAKK